MPAGTHEVVNRKLDVRITRSFVCRGGSRKRRRLSFDAMDAILECEHFNPVGGWTSGDCSVHTDGFLSGRHRHLLWAHDPLALAVALGVTQRLRDSWKY